MGFNLTDFEKLEALHAEVRPSAPAEIYQAFSEMAKALREAWEMEAVAKAFHDVAVKERDYERVRGNRIEKERDEARAEVERLRDRMQLVADDIRHEASARRAELAAPRGGQSCGPRGGPLAGANPGVVQGVESWAKALEEVLKLKAIRQALDER